MLEMQEVDLPTENKMYSDVWGIKRLNTKWAELFKSIRADDINNPNRLVTVTKTYIILKDGPQIMRIERNVEWEFDIGFYLLTQDRFLVLVANDETNINSIKSSIQSYLDISNRDKTASINFGFGHPLVAIAQAIPEFNCLVNLDAFRKTLEALEGLNPEFARIYGFKEKETAQFNSLIIDLTIDGLNLRYATMPLKPTDDLLTVDDLPLFAKQAS